METPRRIYVATVFLITIATTFILTITSLKAEPLDYVIDPEHFSVGFLVDHIGYAKILGMFLKAEGRFTFDEQEQSITNLYVQIDTMSVFTNHKKRDSHLRGPDFLNAREFPVMTFKGDLIEQTGAKTGKIIGPLSLIGQSFPLTLDFTWNKNEIYPFGHRKPTIGISARGTFRRSAYGMSYAVGNGWVGDNIDIIIEFEAYQK